MRQKNNALKTLKKNSTSTDIKERVDKALSSNVKWMKIFELKGEQDYDILKKKLNEVLSEFENTELDKLVVLAKALEKGKAAHTIDSSLDYSNEIKYVKGKIFDINSYQKKDETLIDISPLDTLDVKEEISGFKLTPIEGEKIKTSSDIEIALETIIANEKLFLPILEKIEYYNWQRANNLSKLHTTLGDLIYLYWNRINLKSQCLLLVSKIQQLDSKVLTDKYPQFKDQFNSDELISELVKIMEAEPAFVEWGVNLKKISLVNNKGVPDEIGMLKAL